MAELSEDAERSIEEFTAQCRKVVDSFVDERPKEPPKIIYHYTNESALKDILSKGKFWITDIFNLNDPSELEHGMDFACAHLTAAAETGPNELRQFCSRFISTVKERKRDILDAFVLCFSENGDDLGQWRAYGDDGHGFALGFDGEAFNKAFCSPPENHYGIFISYDEEKLSALQKKISDIASPYVSMPINKGWSPNKSADYWIRLSVFLCIYAVYLSLHFKHPAYSNEKEFRFLEVFSTNSEISDAKYRYLPFSLVRYREFNWKLNAATALREIVIGPSADLSLAKRFAEDCVRAFQGGADVKIWRSRIPYQGHR